MRTRHGYLADYLGKKIYYNGEEAILDSISISHVSLFIKEHSPVVAFINECFIVVPSIDHADSLKSYLKQKFWRAYWRILLYRKHPKKIKGESYTPQILKFEIISLYLFILFGIFAFFIPYAVYLSSIFLVILIILTLPLSFKNFRKDKAIGLMTPFISVTRTIVFSLGLIYGVLRL